jgi:hypothetical protein
MAHMSGYAEQQSRNSSRPGGSSSRASLWAGTLAAVAIGLAGTTTFLTKAFHIDDVLYLEVARQILRAPWDPYGAMVRWEESPESLFDADYNPPLWSYMLAVGMVIVGERELYLHLFEGACVVGAAVALYKISRRTVPWPITLTATMILGPAFLPGYNLMLEAPVLATLLWGIWACLQASNQAAFRRRRYLRLASLCFSAAVLTKYSAAVVLVAVALWALRSRQHFLWWSLVGPAVTLAIWSAWTLALYGRPHPLVISTRVQTGKRTPEGIRWQEAWGRVHGTLRAYGAVTLLAAPASVVLLRRNAPAFVLALLLAVPAAWAGTLDLERRAQTVTGQGLRPQTPLFYSPHAHSFLFGFLGFLALAGVVACYPGFWRASREPSGSPWRSPPKPETRLWAYWHMLVIAFGILGVPFLAVRHIALGIVPATLLLYAELAQSLGPASRFGATVVRGAGLLSVLLGTALADADREFANWYREVALERGRKAVELGQVTGNTAWFFGHWGWVYYAQQVGMRQFDPLTSQPKKGDIVIVPLISTWKLEYLERPPLRGAVLLGEHINPTYRSPFRTISREVHYYACGTLNLPWQLSKLPMDDFLVYIVVRDPSQAGSDEQDTGSRDLSRSGSL